MPWYKVMLSRDAYVTEELGAVVHIQAADEAEAR
jgi:hypothetical protein